MSDIHCGVNKVPKGKKLGSMLECAERGQIRYYGLKKIDPKTLDAVKKNKTKPVTREKLFLKHSELNAKKKKLTQAIKDEKNKTKKEKINKDMKKITVKVAEIVKDINALGKKQTRSTTRKGSRQGSRKGSRKGSKKGSKKGSRKGSKKKFKIKN